ncbi:MAG: PfkB family carbohydrate kinase, partial [bacterium]
RITTDALRLADLAKLSQDELEFVTGEREPEKGAARIVGLGPAAVVVTLGDKGAYYFSSQGQARIPPFRVEVADTTGAGDGFAAGLIHVLCRREWPPSQEALGEAARFASAVGALATTGMGAVRSLPTRTEVKKFMKSQSG